MEHLLFSYYLSFNSIYFYIEIKLYIISYPWIDGKKKFLILINRLSFLIILYKY